MTQARALLFVVALLPACDGDHPPDKHLPGPALPECPEAMVSPCDIRDEGCRARIAELAACMRGDAPLGNLRVSILPTSEFASQLAQEQPEPTALQRSFHQALSTFGLSAEAPPSASMNAAATAEALAGVYRPKDKLIIIVDHGRPADGVSENVTFLHEYVHALQDADYDLTEWFDDGQVKSFDHLLALKSVSEGEARFYEFRAAAPLLGVDISAADFDSTLEQHFERVLGQTFADGSPADKSFSTFPYAYGAIQAYAAWRDGGPRGIDQLWAAPPPTTEAVMASVLGLAVTEPNSIPAPDLSGADFDLVGSDTLGAFGLSLWLNAHTSDPNLALAWKADRFTVAARGSQTYALWQIEVESEQAARELARTFTKLDAAWSGERLFVSTGFKSSAATELTAAARNWLDSSR